MAMLGGEGKNSYKANSQGQAEFMERVLCEVVLKYVDEMEVASFADKRSVKVADFGCGASSNTIRNVETILRRFRSKFPDDEGPEFQAFFQDVHEIDFNGLFRSFKTISANAQDKDLRYFAAGVPGSCYDRQLPESSVHFVLCSFVLHWLSQIPPAVCNRTDPAYSGGHFLLEPAKEATIEAYRLQGNTDLANFLEARAFELVPGGIMTLVFGVRHVLYPLYYYPTDRISEQVVNAMISEGLMDSKLRDTFNTYNHFPVIDDVQAILKRYESSFTIEYQTVMPYFRFSPDLSPDKKAGKFYSLYRGIYGARLEAHLGTQLTEEFFRRFEAAFLGAMLAGTIDVDPQKHTQMILIVATRR